MHSNKLHSYSILCESRKNTSSETDVEILISDWRHLGYIIMGHNSLARLCVFLDVE